MPQPRSVMDIDLSDQPARRMRRTHTALITVVAVVGAILGVQLATSADADAAAGCNVKVQDRVFSWGNKGSYLTFTRGGFPVRHDVSMYTYQYGQHCVYKYARDKWKFKRGTYCITETNNPSVMFTGVTFNPLFFDSMTTTKVNPGPHKVEDPGPDSHTRCEAYDIPLSVERWQYTDTLIKAELSATFNLWLPDTSMYFRDGDGHRWKRVRVNDLPAIGYRHW